MVIKTDKEEYKSFNGFECYVINSHRDDDLVEVFVPAFSIMLLLYPYELED